MLPLAEALAHCEGRAPVEAASLELRCGAGTLLRLALQPCAAPG
ncbi:MAG: hypothetical protein U1F49_12905 [Rubrivivax sp.]